MFVFSKFSTNKLQFYKLLYYQNVGIPASQVTKLLSYKIFRVTELLVTKLLVTKIKLQIFYLPKISQSLCHVNTYFSTNLSFNQNILLLFISKLNKSHKIFLKM